MSAVPKLRFPEFETAYAFRYLGDEVAKISSGKTRAESDGKYELYGSTGVIGKTNSPECHGQNILIARVGANAGALNIVEGSYGVTDNTLILSAAETSCLNFIFYFLKSFNLNRLVFGSGQPLVTGGMIKKLKFSRPSLPEQQKIASFLSSVDKKIELLRQKKDALEVYKKGLMQKIFSQEIRFKQDDGSDFPDWEEVVLGKVFSASKGSGLSKDSISDSGRNACVLYGELYTKYEEEIETVLSKTNVSEGVRSSGNDILIPSSTTTTAIDLVNFTALRTSDVLIGGDITILKPKIDLNIKFFAYYLTHAKRYELAGRGQGSTIVHLYFQHIKNIVISVPPLEEQNIIVSILDALTLRTRSISNSIEQMETFKKGLLQQMFV